MSGAAAENRHLRAQLLRASQEIAELKARIGHLQREIEEWRARVPKKAGPAAEASGIEAPPS